MCIRDSFDAASGGSVSLDALLKTHGAAKKKASSAKKQRGRKAKANKYSGKLTYSGGVFLNAKGGNALDEAILRKRLGARACLPLAAGGGDSSDDDDDLDGDEPDHYRQSMMSWPDFLAANAAPADGEA